MTSKKRLTAEGAELLKAMKQMKARRGLRASAFQLVTVSSSMSIAPGAVTVPAIWVNRTPAMLPLRAYRGRRRRLPCRRGSRKIENRIFNELDSGASRLLHGHSPEFRNRTPLPPR